MPGEIAGIREQTRKLKAKATRIALEILEDPSHELYKETFLAVIKNAVPKSMEIAGDEGGPVIIQLSEAIAKRNGINISAESNSELPSEI
jgi:hypothetical protein